MNALFKINRIIAWIKVILTILFFITGYSMVSKFNMNKIIPETISLELHLKYLVFPFIILFFVHTIISLKYILIKDKFLLKSPFSKNNILPTVNRLSSWALFVLVLLYIITGFGITGEYGFYKIIDPDASLKIHSFLAVPFLIMFILHTITGVISLLKRWNIWEKIFGK